MTRKGHISAGRLRLAQPIRSQRDLCAYPPAARTHANPHPQSHFEFRTQQARTHFLTFVRLFFSRCLIADQSD